MSEKIRNIILEGLEKLGPTGWYGMDRWVSMHPDFDWRKDGHWKPTWDEMLEDGTLEKAEGYPENMGYRKIKVESSSR